MKDFLSVFAHHDQFHVCEFTLPCEGRKRGDKSL